GPQVGYVLLSFAPTAPFTVEFSTSPTGQLTLPASVVVPSGETYASFEFSVVDDVLVNLNHTVTVTPLAAVGITVTGSNVVILDNEAPPVATLTLPAQLT